MNNKERNRLLKQLSWDYSIPVNQIELLLSGKSDKAGHYNRKTLFIKLIETYPWFTVIQLLNPEDIKSLLSDEVISSLRIPDLQRKYGFIRKRLQELIPPSG